MLKQFCLIQILLFSFILNMLPVPAQAESFFSTLISNKKERKTYQKYNPYLENGTHPHPVQWADQEWYVEDWLAQENSGLDMIQNFYNVDIFRDQKLLDEKTPILVVGPAFYRLSGLDKRRVVHSVDVVYGVTKSNPRNTILLHDWYTQKQIGVFTQRGLILQ